MPLDKALLIVVGSVLHTRDHFNHFATVPSTYEKVYCTTVWLSDSLNIVVIRLHGAGSVNLNLWKWFLVPGALYAVERGAHGKRWARSLCCT